ncbi:MAG TPA: hypothetical protein EYH35_01040 [Thiotrichaceae bacterium]|nr:hypothetical protein [Thiotrichaceae bacterium]
MLINGNKPLITHLKSHPLNSLEKKYSRQDVSAIYDCSWIFGALIGLTSLIAALLRLDFNNSAKTEESDKKHSEIMIQKTKGTVTTIEQVSLLNPISLA